MRTRRFILVIAIIVSFILLSGFVSMGEVYDNREGYRDNLIRFHVIANSDSPEDQEVKLKVRDKVIGEMSKKFEDSKSIDESRRIVRDNLDAIRVLAKQEIQDLEKDFDVTVYFGDYDFPTKSYGNFTLPAGEYEAVRIVIGEGKGQNWWCVMFPPLCFIDITHGLTNTKTQQELKQVLTEEEYKMIINARNEREIPLKLKFKVVELFQAGKMKLAELFSQ